MPLCLAVALSDLYALVLGVVLALVSLGVGFVLVFHALTGRRPFAPRPPQPRASIHDLPRAMPRDGPPRQL